MSKCNWCGHHFTKGYGFNFCSKKCASESGKEKEDRLERMHKELEYEQRRRDSLTPEEQAAELAAKKAAQNEWADKMAEKEAEEGRLLKIAVDNHIIDEKITIQFLKKKIGLEKAIQLQLEQKKKYESIRRTGILLCKILFFHIYYPVYFIWFSNRENELNEKIADYILPYYKYTPSSMIRYNLQNPEERYL